MPGTEELQGRRIRVVLMPVRSVIFVFSERVHGGGDALVLEQGSEGLGAVVGA